MFEFLQTVFRQQNWYFTLPLLGALLILWWRGRSKVNSNHEIPSVSSIPYFYLLLLKFTKHQIDSARNPHPINEVIPILEGICNTHRKEKMVKIIWGGHIYVLCFEASACESILKSSKALNKASLYNVLHGWLGTGLFTSEQDKWKIRRKMLNPAFHLRKLKEFIIIFNEQSNLLVNKLKKCSGQEIKIEELVAQCALDIIAETALGVQLKTQENEDNKYIRAVTNLSAMPGLLTVIPWYWISYIFNLTPTGKAMREDLFRVHNFSRKVIRERKAKLLEEMENSEEISEYDDIRLKKPKAILDLLLHHHITNNSLSLEDIREEVDTIILGGFDTVTMAISWTLYLLGLHKNIQEKLYKEIQSIFGEDRQRGVTEDDVNKAKYLECVIKESLRLYPSGWIIGRRTTEDIKSGLYTIPANSSVMIFIYALHRDPATFPNPNLFDPDHFLPDNCISRHPFAFIPFSGSQRNCIGQRFAMMEVKIILSNILRNFTVQSVDQSDKLLFEADAVLRPKQELQLFLEKR